MFILVVGLSCPTWQSFTADRDWRLFPLHHAPGVYYLALQGNLIVLFLTNPSPCHPVCLDAVCSMLFTRDWIFMWVLFFFSIIKTSFVDFSSSNFLFFHKVLKIWDSICQLNELSRMKLIGRRYILIDDYLRFFSYYNLRVWFVILVFYGPVISHWNFLWTLITHEKSHSKFSNNFPCHRVIWTHWVPPFLLTMHSHGVSFSPRMFFGKLAQFITGLSYFTLHILTSQGVRIP